MFTDNWPEVINNTYQNNAGSAISPSWAEKSVGTKKGKLFGPEGMRIEFLKALRNNGIKMLTKLFSVVYNQGKIPTERLWSIFGTILKGLMQKCAINTEQLVKQDILKIFLGNYIWNKLSDIWE